MTMTTQERETDAPPDFDLHAAELAARTSKGEQVQYACGVLGTPNGKQVRDFLAAYDVKISTAKVYEELANYRERNGQPDTGTVPKLTDDVITRMDAARARRFQSAAPVPVAPVEPEPEPLEFQSANGATATAATGIPAEDSSLSGVPVEPLESVVPVVPLVPVVPVERLEHLPEPAAAPVAVAPEPVPASPVADGKAQAPVSVPLEFQARPALVPQIPAVPVVPVVPVEPVETSLESSPEQEKQELSLWVVGGCYFVALASLPVSLNTSWRFFKGVMHITERNELVLMAAVMEMALVMCGIGMAHSVKKFGTPGAFRLVVWGICLFSGWTAWWMSNTLGEALARMVLGPILGAIMLHLALGLIRRTHHQKAGTLARVGREFRERWLSRLGLADDDRTAAQRTRDRKAHRASATRDRAARRAAALALGGVVPLRKVRLARALAAANVAHDPGMRAVMLAELATRRHAFALLDLDQGSPWAE